MSSKASVPKPPVARKVPKRLEMHGEVRSDDYYWMRDRSNPGVIEYVEAENRYTDDVMKHTSALQKRLFEELISKIRQTDQTVPVKMGSHYYYSRTKEGLQYPIYCRKKGTINAPEEVILDVNAISEGNIFFGVDLCKASPNNNFLMYLADTTGNERHTIFFKDLRSGELLHDRIENVSGAEWANDNKTIFYTTMDIDYRPYKVFRHVLGTDTAKDDLVLHEKDRAFYYNRVVKSKNNEFIILTSESATTTEVHYVSADRPLEPVRSFAPRRHGIEYFVIPHEPDFLVVSNENAPNFKILKAPKPDPDSRDWKELVPHSDDVSIDISHPIPYIDVSKDYMAIFEREDALPRIRIIDLKKGDSHFVELPEKVCHVVPVETFDFLSPVFRFEFSSLVTPTRTYDYDARERRLALVKQEEVPGHDADKYETRRIHATAKDGARVPISVVYKKGIKMDGRNPAYLYGYGGYGDFEGPAPFFDSKLLPLLDRGFVCAKAHVRGGGDLGKRWHEDGRMLRKMNTFTDFIACAEHLVKEGYTSRDRLTIRGRSAGGLLMGAVTNLAPDLFKVVVAEVPFVDVISTMGDPSIPLTVGEFEEWGNSEIREQYEYFKLYSPYDNVEKKRYPNILVTGALNDARVQYWEPLKWVAKLRANKTDQNLILLRIKNVEGHSGASGRYDYLKWYAFMYAFIFERVGIRD